MKKIIFHIRPQSLRIFVTTFILITLNMVFTMNAFADHDFKYKNVFACGPSIVKDLPQGIDGGNYFAIHDNEEGDKFSIYSKEYEYSSFKKIHYTELYVQRGGERWLNFNRLTDSIIRFELYNVQKEYGKYLTVLTFDMVGMSAIRKDSWREETELLVCWNYGKNVFQ